MKNDSFCYETTGFGLFFFALALLVIQLGVAILDNSEYPIIRAAVILLPVPLAVLALPWTARRGVFTRQGLTVCWGRLFSAAYSWDDLLWTTNVEKQDQGGSFQAYIRHKNAPNPIHPLYTFFFMMEGIEKGYLLRGVSGRGPDKGILAGEERELIPVTILTPEERQKNEKIRRISYYLMCFSMAFCLTPAWYFIDHGEGWRVIFNSCVSLLLMLAVMGGSFFYYMYADQLLIFDAIHRFKKEAPPHVTEKALL